MDSRLPLRALQGAELALEGLLQGLQEGRGGLVLLPGVRLIQSFACLRRPEPLVSSPAGHLSSAEQMNICSNKDVQNKNVTWIVTARHIDDRVSLVLNLFEGWQRWLSVGGAERVG